MLIYYQMCNNRLKRSNGISVYKFWRYDDACVMHILDRFDSSPIKGLP